MSGTLTVTKHSTRDGIMNPVWLRYAALAAGVLMGIMFVLGYGTAGVVLALVTGGLWAATGLAAADNSDD